MKRIFALLRTIKPDLAVFAAGLFLFTFGLFLIYIPAGLIGAGLILMVISLFGDKA